MSLTIPETVAARLRDAPYPVLFATVSGAHLYGFESSDSDWDLRGAFVAPTDDVLSLSPGPETHEVIDKHARPELDIVLHEVRKFFRLLLKNNGYVLEQVFSPLIVAGSSALNELRHIARLCISKQHRFHFFHFGCDQWKIATGSDKPTVKGLLYTYRPLMAGIHLMRTGEVESNLVRLNEVFGLPEIDDLIARKIGGEERMRLSPGELDLHRPKIDHLCQTLDEAKSWSRLPEEPQGREALNDLLIRIRKCDWKPVPSCAVLLASEPPE